ncbi:MAG: CHASE3 domain-containing protein [Pseudomonadota bacterium]
MYFTSDQSGAPRLPFYKTILCMACVLILIVNGVSLFHNLGALKGASFSLGQTARVGDRLQYLNVLVMDAESSLRGYFISGSDVYLGPSRTVEEQVETEFKELETLLADNPSQLDNLAYLRTIVDRRLAIMKQALDVYREGGLGEIVKIAKTDDTKIDEIHLQVHVMVTLQNEILAARSAAFYREYQKAVVVGVGTNVVAIAVLVMFYRLVRRSYFTRAASEKALQNANENLESMVVQRTGQLAVLSRHLINVSEKEKSKLARELHDEMGASLTAIGIDLSVVGDRLRASEPELCAMLERARASLIDAVELKRRIVEDLRPSLLDNLGLSAALHSYCEQIAGVTRLDCEVLIDGEVDGAGATHAIAVFRIVQESLNNIVKYASASHVIVQLAREGEALSLQVIDNGVGIDADALRKPMSHGLLGMRERALLLDGTLKVVRGVNNVGTCVDAWLPLAPAKPVASVKPAAPIKSTA